MYKLDSLNSSSMVLKCQSVSIEPTSPAPMQNPTSAYRASIATPSCPMLDSLNVQYWTR
ncbi:MAG: hypothetical protein QXP68_04185 [Thermosphaera sp.]